MGGYDGDDWFTGGIVPSEDGASIFSMLGESIDTTTDYRF
jgi:hypothetical protein